MQSVTNIQAIIHKLEFGLGPRILRVAMLVLAVISVAGLYDLRGYKSFATQQAMDQAQLARNLSEGKGYSTLFIRPFSLFLVQRHNQSKLAGGLASAGTDFALIATNHPDLANPPVYPLLLAGMMKVLPFHFKVETQKSFWSDNGAFQRYQPEFLIAIFNQILLIAVALFTFFIARKLFDSSVAWISALLVFGCDQLWQFSVSGLSTMLLIVIFLGIFRVMMKIEEVTREPQTDRGNPMMLAAVAGLLIGVGALTRYEFGWLIIPAMAFLVSFCGQRRVLLAITALGTFVIVLLPWLLRNESLSGTLFGTAGYAVSENTIAFPGFNLQRSIAPDLQYAFSLKFCMYKFLTDLRGIFQNDLPKLGGSWAAILFLAGLLLGFRNQGARRLRYFLVMCLGTFVVFQAFGQTQLSDESPEINSENLLVLVVPLMFVFGTVFFLTFLEQMNLQMVQLRHLIIGAFVVLSSESLIATLAPPKSSPVVNPPYLPPEIQQVGSWMKPDELMMSDVPWAVAWYGQRQCVWTTLDDKQDFFAINDYLKPVQGLYLSMLTLDGKLITDCVRSGKNGWSRLALDAVLTRHTPPGFPLSYQTTTNLSSGLFLSDRQRW